MTSHRRPRQRKPSMLAILARLRFSLPCLPSIHSIFGCTDGRIWWIKTGWYMNTSLPSDEW